MLICVDLDGTLLDTIPANAASYRAALEEQGFTVTDEYYAQYCNGGYYKQFLRPLMGGDPAPEAVERVHDRKKELYSSCLPMVRPNTSLLAILQAMKAAGHDLACVTTGSRKTPPRCWSISTAQIGSASLSPARMLSAASPTPRAT